MLNDYVWTTDRKGKKPVMVWLHGGGFDSGTSAWDPGMALAKKDVVVVGVNHRLNILGFLDLSTCGDAYKYSGNVGMLDVVAASRNHGFQSKRNLTLLAVYLVSPPT